MLYLLIYSTVYRTFEQLWKVDQKTKVAHYFDNSNEKSFLRPKSQGLAKNQVPIRPSYREGATCQPEPDWVVFSPRQTEQNFRYCPISISYSLLTCNPDCTFLGIQAQSVWYIVVRSTSSSTMCDCHDFGLT